jgi:hypothetical protein
MKIYFYLDSGKPIIAICLPTHKQVLDEKSAILVEPTERAMAAGLLFLLKNSDCGVAIARFAQERAKKSLALVRFRKNCWIFTHWLKIALP